MTDEGVLKRGFLGKLAQFTLARKVNWDAVFEQELPRVYKETIPKCGVANHKQFETNRKHKSLSSQVMNVTATTPHTLGWSPGNAARLHQAAKDSARAERYRRIRELHLSCYNQYEIAAMLGINRQTIRRVNNMTEIPEHGNRRKSLIPFIPYLQSECQRGNRNATALYRVMCGHGYTDSYKHVLGFVHDFCIKWMSATEPIAWPTTPSPRLKMQVAPKPSSQWLSGQRTELSAQT